MVYISLGNQFPSGEPCDWHPEFLFWQAEPVGESINYKGAKRVTCRSKQFSIKISVTCHITCQNCLFAFREIIALIRPEAMTDTHFLHACTYTMSVFKINTIVVLLAFIAIFSTLKCRRLRKAQLFYLSPHRTVDQASRWLHDMRRAGDRSLRCDVIETGLAARRHYTRSCESPHVHDPFSNASIAYFPPPRHLLRCLFLNISSSSERSRPP